MVKLINLCFYKPRLNSFLELTSTKQWE